MRLASSLALLFALQLPLSPAWAQDDAGPKTVLERLFEAPEIEEDWFAPAFLAQVPAAQVETIVTELEQEYGALQSITGEGQNFTVQLERAEVPTRLVLDDEGRVIGLLFQPPVASGTVSEQVDAITALPGETAVLVRSNGDVQVAHNADAPLAVGSAAKLAILKAVSKEVAEGRLSWDRVVQLDPNWRSLPTGILQDWPADTPVTVATLANLMISISDNTATDALIRLAGREAVEAVTPRNTPFPTTRELFILKSKDNAGLRQAWIEGDDAAKKRDILDQLAPMPLPDPSQVDTAPSIGVEWFFSARELCDLMKDVAGLPPMHINSGVAAPENWEEIAFKGGSEPGVLNFTTWLEDQDSQYCVVATWNDASGGLDQQKLVSNYRAILNSLGGDNSAN